MCISSEGLTTQKVLLAYGVWITITGLNFNHFNTRLYIDSSVLYYYKSERAGKLAELKPLL